MAKPMQKAHASPRCRAKSKRSGVQCRAPAVRGKQVCRMHGARSGAPTGASHGSYRHGLYTCEAVISRQAISSLISAARQAAGAVE
ncbi:MAG: hypothetical protein E5X67_35885 [Mesorhizobium sp.]|nr:MAG: hypothetical protein EOR01_07780 [Mesorhizobium sp.]TIP22805.1 MAG: hypothetical protein E5X67_35885 [Mesorhizobium sp.]